MAVRGSEKHATHLREARGCTHIFAEDARVQVERAAFGEEIERRRPGDRELRPSITGLERDLESVVEVPERSSISDFFLGDEEPALESCSEEERSACHLHLANIGKALAVEDA